MPQTVQSNKALPSRGGSGSLELAAVMFRQREDRQFALSLGRLAPSSSSPRNYRLQSQYSDGDRLETLWYNK